MLIQFSVSNFRSIGEKQLLSFVPNKKQKEYNDNILHDSKYEALNGIAIYGSNGSGKSNLLKAIETMLMIINMSAGSSSTSKLPYDPFLLREGFNDRNTEFEVIFTLNSNRYRYGFEYNSSSVSREWLYRKAIGRETRLFEREGEVIDVSAGFKGSPKLLDIAIDATRENTLFLSVCDMLNLDEAKQLMSWFAKFNVIKGDVTRHHEIQTASLLQNPQYGDKIRTYMQNICLDIQGVEVKTKEFENEDLPPQIDEDLKNYVAKQLAGKHQIMVMAQHNFYDADSQPTGNMVKWNWDERESSGSQKAMHLSGPILWTLATGGVLIMDEVEAYLHPLMTLNTIDLFLNPKTNVNKAQLIFATHDIYLLNNARLRRDQICFAEKNRWESTELYSLSDFRYLGEKNGEHLAESERPDVDKTKRYMEGRYGAVPNLNNFDIFINRLLWQEREN